MPAADDSPKLTGAALAQDLFEDMRRQVDNVQRQEEENTTEQRVVEEIESLCMNCHKDGVTRLLLTRIPFFKEIVVMSFACEHCGFRNSEIQSAGQIQDRGARYALKVQSESDLQRQVVKSDTCTFKIEDIDLEIPAGKGRYTNIEGLISSVRDDLASHQDARMEQMPEVGQQVAGVIQKLTHMLEGQSFPFLVSADDPSGNSWIEPSPRDNVGKYTKSSYPRNRAQNELLGLGSAAPATEEQNATGAPETVIRPEYHSTNLVGASAPAIPTQANVDADEIVENQVYTFPASCPSCFRDCDTHMKMVNIPYFKQVVIMSTVCQTCGYRSNEVKTGGEVPEKGQRITLQVRNEEDLARDILKGESAALSSPELQLHVEPGTLGGRFTTVEGLLTQFRRDLRAQAFDLQDGDDEAELAARAAGDSMASETKRTWEEFFATLTEAIEGKKPFTLVIQDPLAGSYVQSLTAPEKDPQIEIEEYTRTAQEEEELGLSDMKVEGYEQPAEVGGDQVVNGGGPVNGHA